MLMITFHSKLSGLVMQIISHGTQGKEFTYGLISHPSLVRATFDYLRDQYEIILKVDNYELSMQIQTGGMPWPTKNLFFSTQFPKS